MPGYPIALRVIGLVSPFFKSGEWRSHKKINFSLHRSLEQCFLPCNACMHARVYVNGRGLETRHLNKILYPIFLRFNGPNDDRPLHIFLVCVISLCSDGWMDGGMDGWMDGWM